MDADARDTPSPPAGGACGASVSFAPEDSSRKLLELERTLAAKDAIMEPGVMDSLRTYVASGGKPAAAIEDEGGRAVWSGVAAVLAVNAVLVAYVVSAAFEENGFGRNPMVDARADARETEGDGREKRE